MRNTHNLDGRVRMQAAAMLNQLDFIKLGDKGTKVGQAAHILICMLEEAGFIDVQDVSADVRDVHSEGWASVLPQISIIVSATKTATGSPP